MKAAIVTQYNKNDLTLKMTTVDKPQITADQVLLKVSAAGVNPLDNMITRGEVKLIVPYKLPVIGGNEVVGKIEAVGANVTQFSVGERVFSRLPLDSIGAFAQYVAVDANAIAKVPPYLSDVQAAAIPLTALTVMQAFELMQVKKGNTIFISGGTGGVGAMAIPLAKAKGLKVITNGSVENKERILALGVDRFIDYKTEDYTQTVANVDYVLDTLGGQETEKQMTIMKKGGQLVSLKGMPNGAFDKQMGFTGLKRLLFSFAGRKFDKMAQKYGVTYNFIFVQANGAQLTEVAKLFTKLELKPSLDTVYAFSDVNAALDKVANGRSCGKTVLDLQQGEK